MTLALGIKEGVFSALDDLSPSSVSELSKKQPPRLAKLGGLWQDLPPIHEDDIAEARQEMWGSFGEREL